jgi:uncharacterized protein YecT (DUF1311 family)
MRQVIILALLTFTLLPITFAKKQKAAGPLTVTQCLNLNDTAKIFECFDKFDKQEEDLIDGVYNKLMAEIKSRGETERANLLREAERSWIKFRDNECAYNVSLEDGPGEAAGAAKAICQIQETQKRRQTLSGMLQEELAREASNQ